MMLRFKSGCWQRVFAGFLLVVATGWGAPRALGAARPGDIIPLQAEVFRTPLGDCVMLWLNGVPGELYRIERSEGSIRGNRWANWVPLDSLLRESGPVVCVDFFTFFRDYSLVRAVRVRFDIPHPPATRMIWLEPGQFLMGASPDDPDQDNDENPRTLVSLTERFAIGAHEVTQEQYEAVMGENPSRFKFDKRHPATNMTWKDAVEYCRRLTSFERSVGKLGDSYAYRLPTEAEWEYACRAGSTTRFHYGDDPNYEELGEYAWFSGNAGVSTQPVMTKRPNQWGIYGMHGNVHEWCQDLYGPLPGGHVENPKGGTVGSQHVIRGGSWLELGKDCRTTDRHRDWFTIYVGNVGFRVVLAPVEQEPRRR